MWIHEVLSEPTWETAGRNSEAGSSSCLFVFFSNREIHKTIPQLFFTSESTNVLEQTSKLTEPSGHLHLLSFCSSWLADGIKPAFTPFSPSLSSFLSSWSIKQVLSTIFPIPTTVRSKRPHKHLSFSSSRVYSTPSFPLPPSTSLSISFSMCVYTQVRKYTWERTRTIISAVTTQYCSPSHPSLCVCVCVMYACVGCACTYVYIQVEVGVWPFLIALLLYWLGQDPSINPELTNAVSLAR